MVRCLDRHTHADWPEPIYNNIGILIYNITAQFGVLRNEDLLLP